MILKLSPNTSHVQAGQIFQVEMEVFSGMSAVDSVSAYLDYDPALLQAVDAAGAPAATVEPGAALSRTLLNRVDAARGWADYVATSAGGTAPSGQFVVARLRFKVLAAGHSTVRFSLSDWRPTDVLAAGESALGGVAAAQVAAGGDFDLYLPLIIKR